jgi:bacterioferritin-associated ferredoxin
MIICVCKAVSERHIKKAVADGALSMRDLTRDLGVGTCCGKCVPDAKQTLCSALQSRDASTPFFGSSASEFAT